MCFHTFDRDEYNGDGDERHGVGVGYCEETMSRRGKEDFIRRRTMSACILWRYLAQSLDTRVQGIGTDPRVVV